MDKNVQIRAINILLYNGIDDEKCTQITNLGPVKIGYIRKIGSKNGLELMMMGQDNLGI